MLNNFDELVADIASIKQEVKDICYKVDLLLEIMNSFTVMLAESDEDEESEDYDSDQTWVPKEDDFWENGEE